MTELFLFSRWQWELTILRVNVLGHSMNNANMYKLYIYTLHNHTHIYMYIYIKPWPTIVVGIVDHDVAN